MSMSGTQWNVFATFLKAETKKWGLAPFPVIKNCVIAALRSQ
jgi:hypothetical protein